MNRFYLKQIIRPLENQRGVAALMSVILGIVIMAAVAFNFLAESRQKQAGAILTYTSTNAFMIAEAGLRYAERCLTETEATCPSGVNEQSDWTNVDSSDNIAATNFGGGTFAIYFPGSTDPVNATGSPNDQDNIRVISVGTYKGAERSIQRIVQRACFLSVSGATSCLGTTKANNSDIDPDPPASAEGVCGDIVDALNLTDDFTDPNCDTNCDGSDSECPNFDRTLEAHHETSSGLLKRFKFCDMIIDTNNLNVLTSEADNTDDHIAVARNLTIEDSTLRLSDDAADPNSTDETTITVYGNALIAGTGELRLKGALTLKVGGTFIMENSTSFNVVQGKPADASVWVEGNVTLGNSSDFIGALASDGTILVSNNADITGAIQAQTVTLENNAEIDFDEDAGENTEGYEQCGSSDVASAWAE